MDMPEAAPDPPPDETRCPIDYALQILGDRWTLLLLRDCMLRGKRRYGEFLSSEEGISTNILASRLHRMQDHGLLEKWPDPRDGKTALYLPTDKGLALLPVILEVIRWGLEHDTLSTVPDAIRAAVTGGSGPLALRIADAIRTERESLLSPANHG